MESTVTLAVPEEIREKSVHDLTKLCATNADT